MKAEYVTLLTVTISLLSGWGGSLISGYLSRKASTEIIEKEYKLSLQKRRESERRELLQVYVTIIKLDFEKSPITHYPNGALSLDDNYFSEEIRPVMYDKYYLIHEDVILHFNQIENKSAEINATGNFGELDAIDIAYSYENMIEEIKLIVDTQRTRTL